MTISLIAVCNLNCLNGGTCRLVNGQPQCQCPCLFSGSLCQSCNWKMIHITTVVYRFWSVNVKSFRPFIMFQNSQLSLTFLTSPARFWSQKGRKRSVKVNAWTLNDQERLGTNSWKLSRSCFKNQGITVYKCLFLKN